MSLNVIVAGASGFLGTHLTADLAQRGHSVTRLVRRAPSGAGELQWNPDAGEIDEAAVAASDVVVNLGGSPLVGNVHSSKWAHDVRASRVATSGTVSKAIAAAAAAGKAPALVNASGVAYYGDHGSEVLTEASDSRGDALLTSVSRDWEAATAPAREAGARVALLRTAPVQDRSNPPLKQQRLQFLAGLGGKLGDGKQYAPLISLRDWISATVFLIEHPTASGPFNLCAPQTPTNAEFTETLASLVKRPAFFRAPKAVLKVAAGEFSPELLNSLNLRPAALLDLGFTFADPDVRAVLTTGLKG
ncbi:TIGR01777 family oxidoreductase [Nocardioides sp.]|uniref:TIGR01777 family oxidoreductase n=1 Tax=Nocardioides sp. TaxID=35761 RepID=UPI0035162EAC